MSKQHITVDVIIGFLEYNKDVLNAKLEEAGESASIQLDVKVNVPLPSVNGAGNSGVPSSPRTWSLEVIVNKDNS